ncbi:MAG: hypothetical protein VW547_02345 [Alphaproteobacteria bacterium]|jgi:hypothetical protein
MLHFARYLRPEPVLLTLWALELVRLAWHAPALSAASGWLMVLFVVLAAPRLRRGTLYLCLPLVALSLVLASVFDQWGEIMLGFESASVFMAFFGSIVLLRAIADSRPEISRARALFTNLKPEERNGAFLVGSHLIGSVLVVGVMAILSPILDQDTDAETRRQAAEVSQRGMCLAPLWSPFWVAAAFAAQQIPGVPAWEIMTLGIAMATAGLVLAHLMYARSVGLCDLWRSVLGFAPIVPSVAACAALIAVLSSVAGLSTLKALIAAVPLLALAALAGARLTQAGRVGRETWQGTGRVADEIVVVTTALVLGRILEGAVHAVGLSDIISGFNLPAWAVIAAVIGTITLAALASIHQLVSMLIVLVVFMPLDTGVSDVVMMEAALIGWAFASMIGVTAVSTATASSMFRVPRSQLIFGTNLAFVAAYGAFSVPVLWAVNALLFPP